MEPQERQAKFYRKMINHADPVNSSNERVAAAPKAIPGFMALEHYEYR
jgi:hypothetical protein